MSNESKGPEWASGAKWDKWEFSAPYGRMRATIPMGHNKGAEIWIDDYRKAYLAFHKFGLDELGTRHAIDTIGFGPFPSPDHARRAVEAIEKEMKG